MIKIFGQKTQISDSMGNYPLIFDVSRLREDERLEFKYDRNHKLIAIQKIKLSLLKEPMEGVAQTDIPPGGYGRVFYQGSSWKALCDDESCIVNGQTVLVKARHELTLMVIPIAEFS